MVDIKEMVVSVIEGLGYQCCDVKQSGMGRHAALYVYVDKPGGITVDDLARVSRQLQSELRVAGVPIDAMRLEVSSPGTKAKEANDG